MTASPLTSTIDDAAPLRRLISAINDGERLLVLSPHLDDAILSCGALLTYAAQYVPVTVATFFTEAGPPPYTVSASRYLHQVGVRDARRLYGERRAEDRRVLERMGVEWRHAGLTDAPFRRKPPTGARRWRHSGHLPAELAHVYPTYRLHIASGRIAADDTETVRRATSFLETLLSQRRGPVFAPAGVGRHVDHVLVRTAASLCGAPAIYYSELPYNQRHTIDPAFVRCNGLVVMTWSEFLAEKAARIREYTSQFAALFPGHHIPLTPEVYLLPA
jgi:LmbE family N-acetylglucosaminyl deacetylase